MDNHRNKMVSSPARRRKLSEAEKRKIAKRRAARRRKVYFFRVLFASLLFLIIFGITKLIGLFFVDDDMAVSANTKDIGNEIIEENIRESIDASNYDYIVCIDPGHGYDDEGSRSNSVKGAIERDIVFDLALLVKEKLNEENIGVILTHTTNKIPSDYKGDQYLFGLEKRVDYANSLEIDFYVSIHCDFYEDDSSITGSRIYYLEESNSKLQGIAQLFSDAILSSMQALTPLLMPMPTNDAYYVLRYTNVPAILVETGFLSNKQEAKDMMKDEWRDKMAEGIANGIIAAYQNGNFQ